MLVPHYYHSNTPNTLSPLPCAHFRCIVLLWNARCAISESCLYLQDGQSPGLHHSKYLCWCKVETGTDTSVTTYNVDHRGERALVAQ